MSKLKGYWVLYFGPISNPDEAPYVIITRKPSLLNRIVAKMAGLNYKFIIETK